MQFWADFTKSVWKALGGFQGDPDIAYQFQREPEKVEWIRSGFLVSKQWREKSLKKLTKSTRFVLFTDISGFYENIDLPRLNSDLRAIGVEEEALRVLMRQRYCSDGCRKRMRQQQMRASGRRYQASALGKQNHSKRQQSYR
jgi:hypothetical protein